MKKAQIALLAMALMLFSATASLAAVLQTNTYNETFANRFNDSSAVWSGTFNLTGKPVVGDLYLTLTYTTNFTKLPTMYITGTTPGGDAFDVAKVLSVPVTSIPLLVSPTGGIYNFSAYVTTTRKDAGSSWTLVSASLSDASAKTPIPAAALLLGSGMLGLFGIGKTRRMRMSDSKK